MCVFLFAANGLNVCDWLYVVGEEFLNGYDNPACIDNLAILRTLCNLHALCKSVLFLFLYLYISFIIILFDLQTWTREATRSVFWFTWFSKLEWFSEFEYYHSDSSTNTK